MTGLLQIGHYVSDSPPSHSGTTQKLLSLRRYIVQLGIVVFGGWLALAIATTSWGPVAPALAGLAIAIGCSHWFGWGWRLRPPEDHEAPTEDPWI